MLVRQCLDSLIDVPAVFTLELACICTIINRTLFSPNSYPMARMHGRMTPRRMMAAKERAAGMAAIR